MSKRADSRPNPTTPRRASRRGFPRSLRSAHHLRHLDGVRDLRVLRLQPLRLAKRRDGRAKPLERVQGHAFPEPALRILRRQLRAPRRVGEGFLGLAGLQEARRPVGPGQVEVLADANGLGVVHRRLQEIARLERVVSLGAPLLRPGPRLLGRGRLLDLRLDHAAPGLAQLDGELLLPSNDLLGRGLAPRRKRGHELRTAPAADELGLATGHDDLQDWAILVVYRPDVLGLGVRDPDGALGALVDLHGRQGLLGPDLDVGAMVALEEGRLDGAAQAHRHVPASLEEQLEDDEARGELVGRVLATPQPHGLLPGLLRVDHDGILRALGVCYHQFLCLLRGDELPPAVGVPVHLLPLLAGPRHRRALRAVAEPERLVVLRLRLLLLLVGGLAQLRGLPVPVVVIRHGGRRGGRETPAAVMLVVA
mmetsp:Transcript_103821/g.317971  ORF Transcript_103821/g.317971 Transcript_103821/m.317971 type:complete len:422 (+) Transcript_103821:5-1270(+)